MTLALIAGEGALPEIVVRHLDAETVPFRYCELDGHQSSDRARKDRPITRFRVERLGSFIAELKTQGVTEVCLAGRVARPKLDPAAIDAATVPLVPRMMSALQTGDDGALRLVLSFFEEQGIAVRAAHDIAPDLLPDAGVLSQTQPTEQDKTDAQRGIEIIGAMASVDVGQACIVANGQVLAIETIGGTDRMMRSLLTPHMNAGVAIIKNANLGGRDRDLPGGGLLVKAAKPGQDMRVDVPTIGPDTFLLAAEVSLKGVVIEAGGVMVLDLERCVEIADTHDLIFWVME